MAYQDKIQQLEKQLQSIREKIRIRESRENEDVYDPLDSYSKSGKLLAKRICEKLQDADEDSGL